MPIEDRNLAAGSQLVGSYKKETYVCSVESDEDGKLVYVLADGRRFKSPSSAASAVMGGKAVNGWRFWSPADGDQAISPAALSAANTKRLKPTAGKLFKRLAATGLDEGQYRSWCAACQKSFITTEAEPEACPEGHRADDRELSGPPSADVVADEKAEVASE